MAPCAPTTGTGGACRPSPSHRDAAAVLGEHRATRQQANTPHLTGGRGWDAETAAGQQELTLSACLEKPQFPSRQGYALITPNHHFLHSLSIPPKTPLHPRLRFCHAWSLGGGGVEGKGISSSSCSWQSFHLGRLTQG